MFRNREIITTKECISGDMSKIRKNWHDLSDKNLDKLADAMGKLSKWVKENKEK